VNPFGTDDMAAGYATSRPPVHPRVIEQAYRQLGRTRPFERALDVGCGAGVSTKALGGFAKSCIGLEPAEAMLKWVATIAPSADFVVGAAEAIPLYDRSVDLITAAGSLNYANLICSFRSRARAGGARRVTGRLLAGKQLEDFDQTGRVVFQLPWPLPSTGE
jgi:SAM-dependent methyltransferase